jgi:hypothetical protein
MTSLLKYYAQNDNRVETIELTGFVSENGTVDNQVPRVDQPAYGAIDLRASKNFILDATNLTIRTDLPGNTRSYLINLYVTSTNPPTSTPNYEFNLIVTPPNKGNGTPGNFVTINIYTNKSDAYDNPTRNIYQFVNTVNVSTPNLIYVSQGKQIITFQVVKNNIVLKTTPAGFSSGPW